MRDELLALAIEIYNEIRYLSSLPRAFLGDKKKECALSVPNNFFDEETTISATIRYADIATMLDNVVNHIGAEYRVDAEKRTLDLILYGNDCIIYKTQIEDIYNALTVLQGDNNATHINNNNIAVDALIQLKDAMPEFDRYEQDELVLRYLKNHKWYSNFINDIKNEIERLRNEEQTECVVDCIKNSEIRLRRFVFLKADAEEFVYRWICHKIPIISTEQKRWLAKKKNWHWSSTIWDFLYDKRYQEKKFATYDSPLARESGDILQDLYTVARETYKNYPSEAISDIVSKRVFDIGWTIKDNPLTVRFYVYEIDDKDFVNDSDVRKVIEGLRYQDHYVGNTLSLTVIIINDTVYDFFRTFDAEGAVATMISIFNTI